jgi:hypothetical protein
MKEYKEFQHRKNENPFRRNSQYFYLLRDEVGINSYKSGPYRIFDVSL